MRRPPKRHESHAWKTWGTPPVGGDLWDWQDGRCAWCGTDRSDRLVKDHCHMTGLIRGILCSRCNVTEGKSFDPAWDSWREGDHPAAAMRYAEIYVGWGGTPYSPQSALHYYSDAERAAYWQLLPEFIKGDPNYPWPTEAPWIPDAVARKEEAYAAMRAIDWSFLTPKPAESGESA